MMQIVNRSLKVISSKKISEHWKEKALLAYSRRIMGVTIVVFFGLLVALISASSVLALEWKLFVSSTPFMIFFDHKDVVRHPLVTKIVKAYQKNTNDKG